MKYWLLIILAGLTVAGCSPNNVTIDNSLEPLFKKHHVVGTFGLYNNGQGNFTIYNLDRFKDSAYLPASTFKIVNALIAIETGRINNENSIIEWDKKVRTFDDGDTATNWNQDLTLAKAFEYSAVPHFQEIARRIGKDTMQHYLDTLGYGSRFTKAEIKTIDKFWLDNSVKVTADEQLGLVKQLYFDKLPFQARTQRIVKQMMKRESNSNYTLSYKTGLGFAPNGNAIGWIVGWIEENGHPFMFALNVEGPRETDMKTVRMDILMGALKKLGFLEGKK